MLLTRDSLQGERHTQTESEGMEKVFHANRMDKKVEVAILISDKIDFETNAIKEEKDRHYIMVNRSIQGEDITLINTQIIHPKYEHLNV